MRTITKYRNMEDEIDLNALIKGKNEPFELNKKQILILSIAGSNMYGLNTPDSDRDYLGVYIPTKEQLLLNDFPKQVSLPKSSGLDLQIWSIHYFLNLACQGETMAIDLLHSPVHCWKIFEPDVWSELVNNRDKFFTKGMKSFVSYARKQASLYGIKGKRIAEIEKVIEFLSNVQKKPMVSGKAWDWDDTKLHEHWDDLPEGEHIHFLDTEPYRMYQVCGKKFQETVTVEYIIEHLTKTLTDYGQRAKDAKENNGVDWKAVSHAFRTAEQVHDIIKFGDYVYPLKNNKFIKSIKLGNEDFTTSVQPALEEIIYDVERLIEISDLPSEVDKEYWDEWLIKMLETYVI